jgi:tetratricopeptide (TPR) repeat protein
VSGYRAVRLEALEKIDVAGVVFSPLRRALGVRAFGINVFSAGEAGQQVVEEHAETGSGSGGHEELYVVVSGRAVFTVDGERVDAPAGTAVFVPGLDTRRGAVAGEPDTTVLVIGGPADRPLAISPFEYWFVAESAYRAGDYRRAIEIAEPGLEEWPDHALLNYQLACYRALAGDTEQALEHLRIAAAGDPQMAEYARTDTDLDSIRGLPGFPGPVD